jgi:hypothetical protein
VTPPPNPKLAAALRRLAEDCRAAKGPGRYELPNVTHVYLDEDGRPPTAVYVNAVPIGYLGKDAAAAAQSVRQELKDGGHKPRSVAVEGRYQDAVFYVDRIVLI